MFYVKTTFIGFPTNPVWCKVPLLDSHSADVRQGKRTRCLICRTNEISQESKI